MIQIEIHTGRKTLATYRDWKNKLNAPPESQ